MHARDSFTTQKRCNVCYIFPCAECTSPYVGLELQVKLIGRRSIFTLCIPVGKDTQGFYMCTRALFEVWVQLLLVSVGLFVTLRQLALELSFVSKTKTSAPNRFSAYFLYSATLPACLPLIILIWQINWYFFHDLFWHSARQPTFKALNCAIYFHKLSSL